MDFVGDDVHVVVGPAAGHGDVHAALIDGPVDQEEGVVDGAALRGGTGLRVSELDVVCVVCVVGGGEPDGAVVSGGGDRATAVQFGYGPLITIVNRDVPVGLQVAVVAAGDDPVTDTEPVDASGDRPCGVEFTGRDASALRQPVELPSLTRCGTRQRCGAVASRGSDRLERCGWWVCGVEWSAQVAGRVSRLLANRPLSPWVPAIRRL